MRVLVISHHTDLTGAPLSLLEMLRHFADRPGWEIRVVTRKVGPLLPVFEALAPVDPFLLPACAPAPRDRWRKTLAAVLRGQPLLAWQHLCAQGADRLRGPTQKQHFAALASSIAKWQPSVVYSNTAMNGDVIDRLRLECPVVVHVRELARTLSQLDGIRRTVFKHRTDHFLAVSEAVRRHLQQAYGLAPCQITQVPPAIDCAGVEKKARETAPDDVRRELHLRRSECLIGAAGFVGARKGIDLFVEAARCMLKQGRRDLRFVWVGGGPELEPMRRKLRRAGLARRIQFVGRRSNPYPLMAAMDILLVPSRDDPMPRVMLEAALLGVPAIAFENSGGAREFLGQNRGMLVADMNPAAMAEAAKRLLDDIPRQQTLAKAARKEVRSRFTADLAAGAAANVLEGFAKQRPPKRPHFSRPQLPPLPDAPGVSAVLTSYNTSAYIAEAVESVFAQTYRPLEIIAVDDGSADDSIDKLEELAARATVPMRVFKRPHGGQGKALNAGFAAAQGDIICTLDGDDVWRDVKVERIVELARSRPEAGVYQHQLETSQGGLKKAAVYEGDLYKDWLACREVDVLADKELVAVFLPTSALAWRRTVLDHIGPIPDSLTTCPDAYLTRAACCYGPVAALPDVLGAWRDHGNNASRTHAGFREFWLPVVLPAVNAFFHERNVPVRFVHRGSESGAS